MTIPFAEVKKTFVSTALACFCHKFVEYEFQKLSWLKEEP
jgi:hypothetical protein